MVNEDQTRIPSDGWLAKALMHHRAGEFAEAERYYRKVLEAIPDHLIAGANLGACLIDRGWMVAAFDALTEAHEHHPEDPDILNNLGNALQRLGGTEDAAKVYRQAHDLHPAQPVISLNLGRALLRLGETEEAQTLFENVETRHPEIGAARFLSALAIPFIGQSTEQYARHRERLVEKVRKLIDSPVTLSDPANEVGMTNFASVYHGDNDREIQELLARAYLAACPSLNFTAPHCSGYRPATDRRIRIGFASAHLGSHTIGKLNRRLIEYLDRDKFEVFVFHLGPYARDRDSDLAALAASADHFEELAESLTVAHRTVAAAELDILYYPDIGMEPMSYFLGFARLAPLQCVIWGHPVTTGLPEIDYFISSSLLEPGNAEAHYSEELILFPDIGTSYTMPDIKPATTTRGDFGLSDEDTLYMCPQSLFKLHPTFDDVLKRILTEDTKALVVLIDGQQESWSRLLKARFKESLGSLSERVVFLPRMPGARYLSLMEHANIILDSTVFCGGNSSLEAFAVGKAVVTQPSPFLRGRITAGFYRQMGITDCLAESDEDYATLAVALANDPERRHEIETRIKAAHPVLFDNDEAVRAHEKFFTDALVRLDTTI